MLRLKSSNVTGDFAARADSNLKIRRWQAIEREVDLEAVQENDQELKGGLRVRCTGGERT